MDKMELSDTRKAFDEIVEYNNFHRDVLAPAIAAEDRIVRATIAMIDSASMPDSDEAAVQNIFMDLERHIVSKYGLRAEFSDLVFRLCSDMIWQGDFENGEA